MPQPPSLTPSPPTRRHPHPLPHRRHRRGQEGAGGIWEGEERAAGDLIESGRSCLWDAAVAGRSVRRRPPKLLLDLAAALPYLVAWQRGRLQRRSDAGAVLDSQRVEFTAARERKIALACSVDYKKKEKKVKIGLLYLQYVAEQNTL
ncbi:unnamed protein product [Urochloa humidicola]